MSSDIYKDIDRINKRAVRVAAKWGQESDVYSQYLKSIKKLVPASAVRYSKSGIIQISKSNAAQKAIKPDALATIQAVTKTSCEYTRKVTKEYIREYGQGKPTTGQLQEFVDIKSAVKEAAQSGRLKIMYKRKGGSAEATMRQSEKTYAELWAILQENQDAEADPTLSDQYLAEAFEDLPEDFKLPFED